MYYTIDLARGYHMTHHNLNDVTLYSPFIAYVCDKTKKLRVGDSSVGREEKHFGQTEYIDLILRGKL